MSDIREFLDYNPITGVFTWKARVGLPQGGGRNRIGLSAGAPMGTTHRYTQIVIVQRRYYAHRLAWYFMTGEWPSHSIDHINGDGLDNRWSNLRLADKSQNAANSKLNKRNTSGFKGVTLIKSTGKWKAQIRARGEHRNLGHFDTPEAAHAAYVAAATQSFGSYAKIS